MARLGTVRPSRIGLAAPAPRTPDLFGGLTGALRNRQQVMLANEDANDALIAAEEDRQLRLDRSKALVALSDTKARIEVGQTELAKQYDPSGVDFREQADALAEKELLAFRESLPPALQPEFDPDIATYRNNRSAVAYNIQYEMESSNYRAGLAELQKKAMDSIFLGQTTIEDWRPTFESYLANSPLDQASTEALVAETERAIASFELPIQLQDELTNWTQYTDTNAEGLPAGMPGYAVGLSQAIAAVESNGGDYAVMNGGERITDFSDHPRRVGAGGTSTAAGKYQFIESTWDEAAAALGLPDFSPASQEKAFWWYAGKRYTQATGRNIEADLASGDPVLVENVRKSLAGTGSGKDAVGVVWEGLQDMSPQDFFAYVTGGKTIPPGAMSDPAYASLSEIEKANMLALAQQQSAERLGAALKLQNQQREMLVGQMKDSIIGGGITQQQLTSFIGSQGLTQAAASELQNLFNTHNADEVNLGKFGLALQTGGASFGPDERKGFDVLYARESSKAVAELDQEYMNSTLLPFVGRSGYYPAQMVEDLTNFARSPDATRSAFGWQNLALLEQQNPQGFAKAFGEGMARDVEFFRSQSNYYSPAEVSAQIAAKNDPLKQAPMEVVKNVAKDYVKRYPASFSAVGIMDELGFEVSPTASDFAQMGALESEFLSVFETEMLRYRDGDQAYEAAVKAVSSKWGAVSYGGSEPYPLRNPPALAGVPAIGGSLDWVETFIAETMQPAGGYRLGSDHITEYDINTGSPPSYLFLEDIGNGIFLPRVDPETGIPQRIELTLPDMKAVSLDSELWFRRAKLLDKFTPEETAYDFVYPPEALEAATALASAARSKIMESKPKYASTNGLKFGMLNTQPDPAAAEASLAQFGFSSIDEYISFTETAEFDDLMQRFSQ